jgi:hypothetical protein
LYVVNVHSRTFRASPDVVGRLIDTLASADDALWPADRWPAMRFDRGLVAGARGGHGPVRYTIEEYRPGRSVTFRFTRPAGFRGTHGFAVDGVAGRGSTLQHELRMEAVGLARLSWPLVFRPLHDALIEDVLDRASTALGEAHPPARWSARVRLLRRLLARLPRRGVRRGETAVRHRSASQ